MNKQTVTLLIPNATQEQIKDIRKELSNKYPSYKINLIVSGNNDFKGNLYNLLMSQVNR